MNTVPYPKEKNTMETEHKGVKITYNESRNTFEFTMPDGREGSRATLKEAKSRIEELQKKPFKRIKAYWEDWNNEWQWQIVTVTSVDGREAWIKESDGDRRKVGPQTLYPVGLGENDKLFNRIRVLETSIKRLEEERDALIEKLTRLKVEQ